MVATQLQLGCFKNQHQMSLQKQYYQQTHARIIFFFKLYNLSYIPKYLESIIYVTTLRVYTLMVNWCGPNRWDPCILGVNQVSGLTTQQQTELATQWQAGLATQRQAGLATQQQAGLATQWQAGLATQWRAGLATQWRAGLATQWQAGLATQWQLGLATQWLLGLATQWQLDLQPISNPVTTWTCNPVTM